MAIFYGTSGADEILNQSLSPGVTTDPPGLTGTLDDFGNVVFGLGGDDFIEMGEGGGEAYGGDENDTIIGGESGVEEEWLFGDEGDDFLYAGSGLTHILVGGTGADHMRGSAGTNFYLVDSLSDVVENEGDTSDDAIIASIDYKLGENSTVDSLALAFEGRFGPSSSEALRAVGNSRDNTITGNEFNNVLLGKGGSDFIAGGAGRDFILGGDGDDQPLRGGEGRDVIRGQNGDDILWGERGADRLVGGRGDDIFAYDYVSDVDPGNPDRIAAGDGAIAFEGAGAAQGDLIRLPMQLRPAVPLDFDAYVFGGTGKGHISVVDRGCNSMVRVNVDDDPCFEIKIVIEDCDIPASAYSADDFTTIL